MRVEERDSKKCFFKQDETCNNNTLQNVVKEILLTGNTMVTGSWGD